MIPVWATGAAAALLLVVGVLAVRRFGGGMPTVAGIAALVLGAIAIFIFVDQGRLHDRLAERRALDDRAAALSARALANAPLACLDGLAGDMVESACERALFAHPETVAAAASYVAARLNLLADAVAFARTSDPTYADVLARWRPTLEADRFGIVAQVLEARENCNAVRCLALVLLREPDRVRANLKEQTFQGYVARHAADWAAAPSSPPVADMALSAPVASAAPVPAAAVSAPTPASGSAPALAGTARPLSPQYDFPSAASIPPVSIMSAEPPTGATPPSAAPPAAAPSAAAPAPAQAQPRRPPPRSAQRAPQAPPRQTAPPGPPLPLPTPGGANGPD